MFSKLFLCSTLASVALSLTIPIPGLGLSITVPTDALGNLLSHALPKTNKFNSGRPHHPAGFDPLKGLKKISSSNGPYQASKQELDKLANQFKDSPHVKNNKRQATKLTGVVAVFSQQYGFMGYVGTAYTRFFTLSPTQDTTQVLFVTVPSANPGPNFNLAAINMTAPYLAVIDGYSGPQWGSGLPGYGSMTVVQQSSFPASNTNNPTGLASESNIWTINTTTGQLTSTWFNNDGTPVSCVIFYDVTYGDLNFGGDLNAFVNTYHDTDVIATLYFVGLY